MPLSGYFLPSSSKATDVKREQNKKIETYRAGYPRFTALLSLHDPFFLCRNFNRLRARLLLLKQDKLSLLEKRLDEIDLQETSPLFLGKSRCDRNADRLSILSEIESCLNDYDQFTERAHKMLTLSPAQGRDVKSLDNWIDGTGCIAREETAYLHERRELVSLAPVTDSTVMQLEAWVEDKMIRFYRGFRKKCSLDVSTDPNVHVYSGSLIKRLAAALLVLVIVLLLLVPIITCNIVNTVSVRIVVVMVSIVLYLLVLSALTAKMKTIELIIAAVTYTTVLVVFVSGTGKTQS